MPKFLNSTENAHLSPRDLKLNNLTIIMHMRNLDTSEGIGIRIFLLVTELCNSTIKQKYSDWGKAGF